MSAPAPQNADPAQEVATSVSETDPLLGTPRSSAQGEGNSIFRNLILGIGILAQIGNLLFLFTTWITIFRGNVILFSGHPLAASVGVFALIESILILQPTHTPRQKLIGQNVHAAFNLLTLIGIGSGVGIIEYNKFHNGLGHFKSFHAYLGILTSAVLLLQIFVGITMWRFHSLYGGEYNAKSIWKYHRISGYTLLILLGATVITATKTDYIANVVQIKTWDIAIFLFLIAVGVYPRLQKQKLGF